MLISEQRSPLVVSAPLPQPAGVMSDAAGRLFEGGQLAAVALQYLDLLVHNDSRSLLANCGRITKQLATALGERMPGRATPGRVGSSTQQK